MATKEGLFPMTIKNVVREDIEMEESPAGALGATENNEGGIPYQSSEVKSLNRVRLFVTSWIIAHRAPPSMGFSRQEYWSGLPFPSPGDLPNPGIESKSPAIAGRRFNL